MKRIYLDHAAAAPVSAASSRTFMQTLKKYGNPSAAHDEGRAAKRALEEARLRIARGAGVKPLHVTFTSGATEANTLAIEGYVRSLKDAGRTANTIEVMYHPGAHASVIETMEGLKSEGVVVTVLPTKKGRVDLEALTSQVSTRTVLISIEAVSPETGMRHDLRALHTTLPEHTLLHVDATQLPLIESFERERLYADFLTLDAQKVGGVRGVGCLIVSSRANVTPLLKGGGQEGGRRSGTEPVALICAFAKALEEAGKKRRAFVMRSERMRALLIERVRRDIPDAFVLGGTPSAPHLLTFVFPGRDTDYLQALLDKKGYAVGTKSACESDAETGSRMALAETGSEAFAKATLRVSWGPGTSERTLTRFATHLIEAVRFLDRNALY